MQFLQIVALHAAGSNDFLDTVIKKWVGVGKFAAEDYKKRKKITKRETFLLFIDKRNFY